MRLSSPVVLIALLLAAILYVRDGVIPVVPQLANRPSDFENYYLASRNLVAGESPFAVPRFDYPPIIAFLLWPVARLDYETVRWIWFLVSHACILGAAVLTWRALGKDRLAAVIVALLWACGGTLSENLALGQVNPLLLLLVAVAIYCESTLRSGALGAAIAIKLWPAALAPALYLRRLSAALPADTSASEPPASSSHAPRTWPEPARELAATLAVAALLLAAPFALLAAFYPPPHTPPHSSYWMGTPAVLNFAFPAAVLRLLDFPSSTELPHNWQFGNDVLELRVPAAHAALSVAAGVAIWVAGFALLLLSIHRRVNPGLHTATTLVPYVVATLAPLTLAAVPLSWSHYQLLQLPGAALFLVLAVRNRRVWFAAAITALFLLSYQVPVALLRIYFNEYGWTAARPWLLWSLTALTPVALLGLFLVYCRLVRRVATGVEANCL